MKRADAIYPSVAEAKAASERRNTLPAFQRDAIVRDIHDIALRHGVSFQTVEKLARAERKIVEISE